MAAGLRRADVPRGRITRALADLRRTGGEVAGLRLEALGDHLLNHSEVIALQAQDSPANIRIRDGLDIEGNNGVRKHGSLG